jgi:CheY-like chemotaxis protein
MADPVDPSPEERLRASEERLRAVSGVAHDLNNLLTAILASADLLLQAVPEGDPSREDLLAIRDAGRRAAALTRGLFTAPRAPPGATGETVLVVDDEPLVRRALGRALTTRGFAVVEASSGDEALAAIAARGGKVDLLLTDVILGEMRGTELVRRFREACPGKPALLMSGYPEDRFAEEAEACEGYLQKPVVPDALVRAVHDALDRKPGRPGGR